MLILIPAPSALTSSHTCNVYCQHKPQYQVFMLLTHSRPTLHKQSTVHASYRNDFPGNYQSQCLDVFIHGRYLLCNNKICGREELSDQVQYNMFER